MSVTDQLIADEFKVVKQKRKSAKRVRHPIQRLSVNKEISSTDIERLVRRIEAARQDLLSSDIYASLKASLREALGVLKYSCVKEIVCFGLGKFGECVVSRYQFAILLCLKEVYNTEVYVYDPAFTSVECCLVNKLGCKLLDNNSEGKYSITGDHIVLFYLPHCPKQLTNNLLWSNWGLKLSHCVIISNSFTNILEKEPTRFLAKTADYIVNIYPYVLELAVINNFKYYDIFNDTAIHVFPHGKLSLISEEFWKSNKEPNYADDIEFITKISALQIQEDSH